jgi:hypothetical protein
MTTTCVNCGAPVEEGRNVRGLYTACARCVRALGEREALGFEIETLALLQATAVQLFVRSDAAAAAHQSDEDAARAADDLRAAAWWTFRADRKLNAFHTKWNPYFSKVIPG